MSAGTATKRRKLGYEKADGTTGMVTGRYAWTLQHLVNSGKRGVTPIERPAPRWSHYVHILRKEHGFDIETVEEKHGGEFAGMHGRYVLRETVKLRDLNEEKRASGTLDALHNPNSTMAGVGGSDA